MKTTVHDTTVTEKFSPLYNRILVKRDAENSMSAGGIHIPDAAKDKPKQGTVIAVGTGRVNEAGEVFPLAVKEGNRVMFGSYSGTEVKLNGETLLIMPERGSNGHPELN